MAFNELDYMNLPKIFCLTLDDNLFRINSCKKEFEKFNLNYEFFYGIDGKKTNLRVIENVDTEQPMNLGRIGCFLSHYMIWQHILHSSHDEVLILEDDFEFKTTFDEILEFKTQLPSDWDLFFVGHCFEKITSDFNQNIFRGNGMCTHGYFIKKHCIRNLLKCILPIDLPIDMKINNLNNNLNIFYSKKQCVGNKSFENIEGYTSSTVNHDT